MWTKERGCFDALTGGEAWTTYTVEDGLGDGWVNAIAVGGEGALWFDTNGGGVSRFQPE